jgi:hypothetical protein
MYNFLKIFNSPPRFSEQFKTMDDRQLRQLFKQTEAEKVEASKVHQQQDYFIEASRQWPSIQYFTKMKQKAWPRVKQKNTELGLTQQEINRRAVDPLLPKEMRLYGKK